MKNLMRRSLAAAVVATAALAALGLPAAAQTLTIGIRAGPESVDQH